MKGNKKQKWINGILIGVAAVIVIAVSALAVKLNRAMTSEAIGGEQYTVGVLDVETGKTVADGDTSIILRKEITTDGLTVKVEKDAKVSYQIFFYDEEGKFISATETLTEDFNGTIPEGAETANVMVTPLEDEDGKVSLVEVLGYANQIEVRVNK